MLLVKTKIGLSNIAGIGLFAAQFIPKGTIVWRFNEKLDSMWSKEDIDTLSDESKKQFHNYAYLDIKHNKYLLCGDDARFFNHSDNANCTDSYDTNFDETIANKDIEEGEEITCNYKSFYGNMDEHQEIN